MEKGGEGKGEAENVGRGGERNVPENLTCWTSCRACCSEVRPLPSTLELRKRTLVISLGLSRWRKDLLDAVGVEEGRREGDSREDAARSAPTFSARMSRHVVDRARQRTASNRQFASPVPLLHQHSCTKERAEGAPNAIDPESSQRMTTSKRASLAYESARRATRARGQLTRSTASSIGSLHSCAIFSMTPDVATLVAIISSEPGW